MLTILWLLFYACLQFLLYQPFWLYKVKKLYTFIAKQSEMALLHNFDVDVLNKSMTETTITPAIDDSKALQMTLSPFGNNDKKKISDERLSTIFGLWKINNKDAKITGWKVSWLGHFF